jgi:hypothetical protein
MEELLKNAKILPNSRLYLQQIQAEGVQTDSSYHGRFNPSLFFSSMFVAFVRLVVGSESKTNKQKCDQSDVK